MKVININTDIEGLIIAKLDIESYWIEQERIKDKLSLEEFLSKIDMSKNIYSDNNEVYPFSIIYTSKENYVFTIANNYEKMISGLESIKYNINNLIKVTKEDLFINGAIEDKPFFIINNKVCLPKDSYEPTNKISDKAKEMFSKIDKNEIDKLISETTENMYNIESEQINSKGV